MTERKLPVRLLRSALTGNVYVLTRYRITGQHPETGEDLITATTKHDVTADFRRIMAAMSHEEDARERG